MKITPLVTPARRPRLARPKSDGGNHASADNHRTNAPDSDRADRSADPDHQGPAGSSGRLARKLKRAKILLAADAGASDEEIARSAGVGGSTVYRTKRRFVLGNLEAALSEEPWLGHAAFAQQDHLNALTRRARQA